MPHLSLHRRAASGFTMLEVLISIVVIAFGLLGVAGLQAFALKNNQSAAYRSVATSLASDMVDRMKANPLAAFAGAYNGANSGAYGSPVPTCLTGPGCSSTELASNDLYEWRLLVRDALPNGSAVVCLDATPRDGTSIASAACDGAGRQYVIKVWWVDDRNTTTPATGFFFTQFEP